MISRGDRFGGHVTAAVCIREYEMESIVKMGVKTKPRRAGEGSLRTPSEEAPVSREGLSAPAAAREPEAGRKEGGKGTVSASAAGERKLPPEKTAPAERPAEIRKPKSSGRGLTSEERADLKKKNSHYRLIARYAVATIVVSYILVQAAGNIGPLLKVLGRVATTVGMLLSPLFWGFVLAYILLPASGFFEKKLRRLTFFRRKRRDPHGAAVAITCVLAALVVVVILSIVVSSITRSLKIASPAEIVNALRSVAASIKSLQNIITERLAEMNISSNEVKKAVGEIGAKIAQFANGLSSSLTGTLGHIGGFLTNLLFTIIFAIYFMLDARGLRRYWNRVLLAFGGRKARRNFHILAGDADTVFSGYIRGQLIDAFIMAILVSCSLTLIGVRYAVIIGILSGIGNLIPYIGPIVAYGSTIIVCLVCQDLKRLLVAIVVLFVIQTVDGNVINPRLLSSNVDVHPMLVIAALIVGGAFGGIVGMLFAVPVAGFFKIQFEKGIDSLVQKRTGRKPPAKRKKVRKKAQGKA